MGSIKTNDLRQRGHIAVVIHRFRGLDEQIFSSIFHDPSQNEDHRSSETYPLTMDYGWFRLLEFE